jgi:pimeloyl-ACP methyl ester carboxylesterase
MTYLHVAGHRLEYKWVDPDGLRAGGRGPTLVFLHEGLGSVALWKDFPERVARATACAVLVYSRYGHGKSDRLSGPRTVDYMQREALETLPGVLDALFVPEPILIGHSDGASISIIYAASGRGSVRGLVLMAPHVFVEDITVASIAQARASFEASDLGAKLARYHDDATATFRGWSDIWLHPDFRSWNIESMLPSVTAPVLLIQGEDDQYGTVAQVEAVARRVRGLARILMLRHCAHSPHVDQPVLTIEAIARFVKEVKRSRGEEVKR